MSSDKTLDDFVKMDIAASADPDFDATGMLCKMQANRIKALEKELADTKQKNKTFQSDFVKRASRRITQLEDGLREIEQHVPPQERKVLSIITKLLEG